MLAIDEYYVKIVQRNKTHTYRKASWRLTNLIEVLLQLLICKIDTELLKTISNEYNSRLYIKDSKDTKKTTIINRFNNLPVVFKTFKTIYIKNSN